MYHRFHGLQSCVNNPDSQGKMRLFAFRAFTVDHSAQQVRALDSLVEIIKPSDISRYQQYTVYVYVESPHTNNAYLKENPRDLDRYSNQNDWIYQVDWVKGNFLMRKIVKDGDFLPDKNLNKIEIIQQKKS